MSDDEDVETFIQNQKKKRKQELQQEVDRWNDMSERYNNPDPLHKLLQERIDLLKTKNTKLQEQITNLESYIDKLDAEADRFDEEKIKLQEQNTSLETQKDALYGELHEVIRKYRKDALEMNPNARIKERRWRSDQMQRSTSYIKKRFEERGEKPKAMCTICLDNPSTHAFMPCGHKCMCGDCADKLNGPRYWPRTPESRVCSICKQKWTTLGQIYEC